MLSRSLLCHALPKSQRSFPFGTTVVAQALGRHDVKLPDLSQGDGITGATCATKSLTYFYPPDSLNDDAVVY